MEGWFTRARAHARARARARARVRARARGSVRVRPITFCIFWRGRISCYFCAFTLV